MPPTPFLLVCYDAGHGAANGQAATAEAAARGLEPLKVPKGSFESLQKSLLGLHGGSNGSCSEGFGAFEGAKGQFRKPTKKLAGPARRQEWKLQREVWSL